MAGRQSGLDPALELPALMTSSISKKQPAAHEQNCGCSQLKEQLTLALDRNSV